MSKKSGLLTIFISPQMCNKFHITSIRNSSYFYHEFPYSKTPSLSIPYTVSLFFLQNSLKNGIVFYNISLLEGNKGYAY